ncbi:MAG: radical SAM protein [Acidobacteriota bacterium]|jgi:uncharacterized protein|nr:radical SAM protein [Acidobacteriota bacterium]
MADDVYLIPAGEVEIAVSPLRQASAAINATGAAALREALLRGTPAPEPIGELASILSEPCAEPAIPTGAARPPFLGLIPTRDCNMGCRYCDFDAGRNGRDMDVELVCAALGGYARHVSAIGGESLSLHFFGGEPFVRFDLVELAVHRLRYLGQKHGLPTHVETTTNGMFGGATLAFVEDFFDTVVLSLDGQAQDHDPHRPLRGGAGSFDRVWTTAQALARSPVGLCVRCCVSAANVGRMPQIAEWLCCGLHPESVAFEAMKPSPQSVAAGLLPPDPLLFARGFLAARRIARDAGVECVYGALTPPDGRPRHTFCPAGRDTFIVAPDWSVRSCYLRKDDWTAAGLDMRVGRVEEGGDLRIDPEAVRRLREAVADRARCRRCFCRWSCTGGCVVTETPPGHGAHYTDYCRQTRLIQVCALLEDMGMDGHADALLQDGHAVARLWEHADDRLAAERLE